MGLEGIERRREVRLSTAPDAYGVRFTLCGRAIDGARLGNLSAGGCGLEVQMADARDLETGTVLEDLLLFHPDLPLVPLQATVVRMLGKVPGKTSGYILAGLEFTHLTPFLGDCLRGHVLARVDGQVPPVPDPADPVPGDPPPLDRLRALLDRLDGEERAQQLAFFRLVLEAGPDALPELDGRLPGPRAPRALRRLAMEASYYLPWPQWVPIHRRILLYEPEHAIFLTGVEALGRIGDAPALAALRELNGLRQGEAFKQTLAEVLDRTDPGVAFQHHLERLLRGSASAGEANEAALRLRDLVDGSRLEQLRTLTLHPDLLVFRHALGLLARVPTPEAAAALRDIFRDSHRETLADRNLKAVLGEFHGLTAPAARQVAAQGLAQVREQGGDAGPGDERAGFYREVLGATQEGRANGLAALMGQTAEAMHARARRLGFALDAAAEGLAGMVAGGLIDGDGVRDLLVAAFRDQVGREGLARAIARLAPPDAGELLQLLLDAPDAAQRAAAVEVLGGRPEPEFLPVLLQACRDPLTDIADRAVALIGRFPGAEDLAGALLRAPAPADFQLGLRLAAQHRFRGLVPALLGMLREGEREDVVVQVVETLGAVGDARAAEPLLGMLHSGQSARLLAATAQALGSLGSLPVARDLCARADAIKLPPVHAQAVEALLRAADGRIQGEDCPLVLDQVRKAWDDRYPWTLRLRLVQQLQAADLQHPSAWLELSDLVGTALAEKRPAGAWSTDELHQMQVAAREFIRRAG